MIRCLGRVVCFRLCVTVRRFIFCRTHERAPKNPFNLFVSLYTRRRRRRRVFARIIVAHHIGTVLLVFVRTFVLVCVFVLCGFSRIRHWRVREVAVQIRFAATRVRCDCVALRQGLGEQPASQPADYVDIRMADLCV